MNRVEAQHALESLRTGIPPSGHVREFTVGRITEIDQLVAVLRSTGGSAHLLKANYGAGKTHLLRLLRETALAEGYAVSSVTLDAKSGVRFNRMDQVLGAVVRGLELPMAPVSIGIRPLFDYVTECLQASRRHHRQSRFWVELSNHDCWDYSEALESPALFIALRAWITGNAGVRDLIVDWLSQPWTYSGRRKTLYLSLIDGLRQHFHDPRLEWQFYADGAFVFNTHSYHQSWAALRDIQRLVQACGMKGLVLLFDEFEDILYNMSNVAHQQGAFWNLFQFFGSKRAAGTAFFAVTPGFVQKCKDVLTRKRVIDYDFTQFNKLPMFEMSPLTAAELQELAAKVLRTHALAYAWQPGALVEQNIAMLASRAARRPLEDRTRYAIREMVRTLDHAYESAEDMQ